MKRHLLLTIVDGFHYRYLVQTGIFDHLLSASDKLVVCGNETVLEMLRERTNKNLILAQLPPTKASRKTSTHLFLRTCVNRRLSETLNIKAEQQRMQAPWRYRLRRLLGTLFDATGIDLSRWVESAWHDESVDQLLVKHEISLVVLSTPGQKIEDLPYLEAARSKGIRTISPVYSWDNLTAKGPFLIPPDQLVVWNEVMRCEACQFHGYAREDVFIGGVPVFDPYAEVAVEVSEEGRSSFMRRIGFNPKSKLITLTTIPKIYFGSCHRIVASRIIEWVRSGILGNSVLLIRPHPLDDTDYTDLQASDVVLDLYGSTPNVDPRQWIPSCDNIHHLARTMAYSSVVINIASTITVDASCFDTPIINIAYDEKQHDNEYSGSILRYYKYTHYKQVVETGAAKIVYSPQQLLSAIQDYLFDRSLGSANRTALVEKQVGVLDGLAAERTAAALLSKG